jgi:arabinofuranosyltransferase
LLSPSSTGIIADVMIDETADPPRPRQCSMVSGIPPFVWVILILQLAYAAGFIARTSFVSGGERCFCLFDDAMISMRYARNLVHGAGLVWNPGGQRVEGFTNPLWVFFMAACHLLPLSALKISLLPQLASAILLSIHLLLVRRLVLLLSPGAEAVAAASMILVGFYLPLNNWALQGMEVGAAALAVTAALCGLVRDLREGHETENGARPAASSGMHGRAGFSRSPYLWLAAAVWIRPDLAVLGSGVIVLSALVDVRERCLPRLRAGLLLLFASFGLQTVLRLLYYGEFFPNTYYLKVAGIPAGLRIERGFLVYVGFLDRVVWIPLLLALAAVLLQRSRARLFLFGVFLVQSAYSMYVGGDAWEWWGGANRYLCAVIAPLLVLAVLGLRDLLALSRRTAASRLAPSVSPGRHEGALPARSRLPFVLGTAVLLLVMNNINGFGAIRQWLLLAPPLHVEDNKEMVRMSRVLEPMVEPDGKIAVVWAGIVPYLTNRPCVDLLGKNDRQIAHLKVVGLVHPLAFLPGHIKYDYAYSIGKLHPDLVSDLVGEESEAAPVLDPAYEKVSVQGFTFYVLRGSTKVVLPKGGA